MNKTPTFRDVEKLSAYLDGQLSEAEARRLTTRLNSDLELAAVYQDLRQARALLRRTPQRRVPRNFTLSPGMAGIKPPVPRVVPFMRLASVLAGFLLFVTFAVNAVGPLGVRAPMAYGIGGGMGGGGGAAEDAAAEPALAMEAPSAPEAPAPELRLLTPTPQPAATMQAMLPSPAEPTPSLETYEQAVQPKTGESETNFVPPPQPSARVVPIASRWQVGLAVLVVLFGGLSFLFVRANDSRWRRKK